MSSRVRDVSSADKRTFPQCPTPPDWTLEWPALVQRFSWLRDMDGCPQDAVFHAEGDVLTHTRLVIEALTASHAWRALPDRERAILFAAALLHDVGKPACTVREVDGAITSRGHARRGAQMARQILWQAPELETPVPFAEREAIVALVRYHGLPPWALEDADPQRRVILVSQVARCRWLWQIAAADVAGRHCRDAAELKARLTLFREFCQELGCLDAPWPFPTTHSRFVYSRAERGDPQRLVYDDTRFEVVLMSGLPGSGKDTWIAKHLPDWPVVSLDALRQSLGVAPEKDQGAVVAAAKEAARALIRTQRSFVWNATNTTQRLRRQLVDFFVAYGARVRIVYVEAPCAELLRRNRARTRPVPETVLRRLATRLDVPEVTEADHVEWVLT